MKNRASFSQFYFAKCLIISIFAIQRRNTKVWVQNAIGINIFKIRAGQRLHLKRISSLLYVGRLAYFLPSSNLKTATI